jgi:plasmid stabilization system protein ParE
MINYDNYAITLGRAVDVFQRGRAAIPEQKVALRALAALARLDGVVLQVSGGELRVAGAVVASGLPGISRLVAHLEGLDVAEIRIAREASPASLLELLRGLVERPAASLAERMRTAGADDIQVRLRQRTPRPTAAAPEPVAEVATGKPSGDVGTPGPHPPPGTPLDARAIVDSPAPDVPLGLDALVARVQEDLDQGRTPDAVRALAQLIHLEAATAAGQERQALTDRIGILITDDALQAAMECTGLDDTRDAARHILRRGGPAATAMLRTRLMTETDDDAARRTLQLLREQPEGLRSLIFLLQHGDHGIVRRAASVLADLGVREAVPALSRVAQRGDPTARAAATAALVQLATPEGIELLGDLIERADAEELGVVLDALGGGALDPLIPRLEDLGNEHRDPGTLMLLGQALGRIGTSRAVAVLARWVAPPGWRFWRRTGGLRLAGVAGLQVAGGTRAVRLLSDLTADADPEVRGAAAAAVEHRTIAATGRRP